MAPHSSTLAWKTPWTEEPGRLQSVHEVSKSRTWLSNFTFTFHFHALEKEMATHSSVLAWRIPGTGEPGGLPSMGSHRVRHDWSDLAAAAAAAGRSQSLGKVHAVQPASPHAAPPHSTVSPPLDACSSDTSDSNSLPRIRLRETTKDLQGTWTLKTPRKL